MATYHHLLLTVGTMALAALLVGCSADELSAPTGESLSLSAQIENVAATRASAVSDASLNEAAINHLDVLIYNGANGVLQKRLTGAHTGQTSVLLGGGWK